MLKFYSVFIIVFCNIAFVLCMEKDRYIPIVLYSPYTSYVNTRLACSYNQVINTANQTDCQNLNAIMRAPYTSNIKPAEKLEPVYQTISHPRTMRVPDYKKNNNDDRMYELYKQVRNIFDSEIFSPNNERFSKATSNCIAAFSEVKQYGITEDMLSEFAFKLSAEWRLDRRRAVLFFGLLKKYNKLFMTPIIYYQTASEKQKISLPEVNPLVKALNISIDILTERPIKNSEEMEAFIWRLCAINYFAGSEDGREFVDFLYSGKTLEQKKNDSSSMVLDSDWKRSFLYKAFSGLSIWRDFEVSSVLELIQGAKKNGYLKTDHDLGYYALEYETTLLDSFLMIPIDISYASKKEKISLVFLLFEKYLCAVGEKITPTEKDVICYDFMNQTSISLPDFFDSRLLDSNYVAFKEYKKLCADIETLKTSSNEVVRICVQKSYPLYVFKDH